jgi:hypothetical protein
MKRLVLAGLAFALVVPVLAVPAFADPPAKPVPAGAHRVKNPGVYVAPETTITGRPNKPMVSVVIQQTPAAQAAGVAHDKLRDATLAKTEPAAP